MDFEYPQKVQQLQQRLRAFIDDHVLPANPQYLHIAEQGAFPLDIVNDLKAKARREGLWNIFLPGLQPDDPGTRLTNLEYAPLAEIIGRVPWAARSGRASRRPSPTWRRRTRRTSRPASAATASTT
jgi:acyl-CoA dehydrogenase